MKGRRALVFGCVVLLGAGCAVLIFGNPTWNRWVYIAQAYHLGDGECYIVLDEFDQPCWIYTDNLRPHNHSGTWRVWSPDGRLVALLHLDDGVVGKIIDYRPDASIRSIHDWRCGVSGELRPLDTGVP